MSALSDLSETTHKAAGAAATAGSTAQYRRFAKGAAEISEQAFGAHAARRDTRGRHDPVASAFASWLAGSGFQILDQSLRSFVPEMIQYWKNEAAKPPAERPTSPHIIARRAQLDRVRTPRMVIRVGQVQDLDRVLAAKIGERVRAGVAQAFGLAVAQPLTAK